MVRDADGEIVAGASGGYHRCLDRLRELLDTGSVSPDDDAVIAAWVARDAAAIAATAEA